MTPLEIGCPIHEYRRTVFCKIPAQDYQTDCSKDPFELIHKIALDEIKENIVDHDATHKPATTMQNREIHAKASLKHKSHDGCPHQNRRINTVDAPFIPIKEISTSTKEQSKTTTEEEQDISDGTTS